MVIEVVSSSCRNQIAPDQPASQRKMTTFNDRQKVAHQGQCQHLRQAIIAVVITAHRQS